MEGGWANTNSPPTLKMTPDKMKVRSVTFGWLKGGGFMSTGETRNRGRVSPPPLETQGEGSALCSLTGEGTHTPTHTQ